jgi:hypothetical protein
MAKCFILTPLLDTTDEVYSVLTQTSAAFVGLRQDQIEMFALVPISIAPQGCDVAIRLKESFLTLSDIEALLEQRDALQEQLKQAKEALVTCTAQLESFRETRLQDEKYRQCVSKLKRLDEDNQQLRRVLQ